MENSKICPNCGANNQSDSNFCEICGKQLIQNNIVVNVKDNTQHNITNNHMVNNQNNYSNDADGNKLGIISLLLYYGGSLLYLVFSLFLPRSVLDIVSVFCGTCPIFGIITMIIGRVKYPTNNFLKIVMWIIIGTIVLSLISFIVFAVMCYITCSSIGTGGCD